MIQLKAHVHMSEAEVAKDFAAVLEKVRQGAEIIVEQDHRPVAVIKTPQRLSDLSMIVLRSRRPTKTGWASHLSPMQASPRMCKPPSTRIVNN